MTRRQASDLARARILDAVRTGASLQAACAAARVSRSNLATWRRQEPAFADAFEAGTAELAATKGIRRGARHKLTEADWDAFLAQLAEGRLSVEQIARLPGMPSAAAFAKRRKADPAFEARLAEVWKPIREREREAVDWEGALARVAAGDILEGFAGTGAYPLAATWFARRKREPGFDARAAEALRQGQEKRAGGRTSPAMLERVLAELSAGKSLHAVCAQPGMPTRTTVKAFGRRSTAFASRLQAAWSPASPFRYSDSDYARVLSELQAGRSAAELRQLGLPGRDAIRRRRSKDRSFRDRLSSVLGAQGNIVERRSDLRAQLSQNELWSAANAAVARGLPSFVRDDVISEMIADAVEGYLDPADFKAAAREYAADLMRGDGGGRQRSLDADVFGEGGRSLHDLVSGAP